MEYMFDDGCVEIKKLLFSWQQAFVHPVGLASLFPAVWFFITLPDTMEKTQGFLSLCLFLGRL